MEVEVLSIQTIKPSRSTLKEQRTYKLCLCDQIMFLRRAYSSTVLFYSSPRENRKTRSDQLKQSLSETLAYFYPFAGRVKDCFAVDCNDEGAVYIETEVDSNMSDVVKEPEISCLLQLLPFDPYGNLPSEPTAMAMASIQVNHFACGGTAIGVCIDHAISDMSASFTFLKSWAAIASGTNRIDFSGVIYDSTTIFTPQDFSKSFDLVNKEKDVLVFNEGKKVTQRFLFQGSKIASLRNEIGNASRFEAIMALIWASMIEISGKDYENLPSVATMVMNLRNRLNPPLPQQCIGNAIHVESVKSPMEKSKINLSCLSAKIRETVKRVDDIYIRKLIADGKCLDRIKRGDEDMGKNWVLDFSSCCRFPLYEIDFGWGKPVWLVTPSRINRFAVFLDTCDGQGIEAWLTLPEESMAELEQDPAILTYATFKPSI